MDHSCSLSQERCIPCEGGVPPLTFEEANKLLAEIKNHWQMNDKGHLLKEFQFTDFKQAMDFAIQVGTLSEEVWHHPVLTVAWGSCAVEIWTHKIEGLARSDFILAAKIDTMLQPII